MRFVICSAYLAWAGVMFYLAPMTAVGFAMGIGWMVLYLACWPEAAEAP